MIGYVAKDKNEEIYLHTEKPTYDNDYKAWFSNPEMINITEYFPEFGNISYEDEPIKVEINIKRV